MFAFFGVFIGCLFLPRMGDLYGRRPVFLVCSFGGVGTILITALDKNLLIMYVGGCIGGCITIGRIACGFLLLLELMPGKN